MEFNREQVVTLAKYFADLSKILFASIVIGFFVPTGAELISLPTFLVGTLTATGCIVLSVGLLKSK